MIIEVGCSFFDETDRLFNISTNVCASETYYKELERVLEIKKCDIPFVRIGNPKEDGGYIMIDDFHPYIAYSFGISNDVSWDTGMAQRGYEVYMYDPTIDSVPANPKFHFFKEGISGIDDNVLPYKTLEHLLHRNNHTGEGMILKMDVEGAEWHFLETVSEETLAKFDQIVLEVHGIVNTAVPEYMVQCLDKLNLTHTLVHVHGNNTAPWVRAGERIYYNAMELTYISKKYHTYSGDVYLPIDIDVPNASDMPPNKPVKWN